MKNVMMVMLIVDGDRLQTAALFVDFALTLTLQIPHSF